MTTRAQPAAQPHLNYKRAITTFISAYISVTILAIALSIFIATVGHVPSSGQALQNQAYLLSERFLPALNLVVWSIFAWAYFRRRAKQAEKMSLTREAQTLGAFWVVAAIVVDYVGFVFIKNPLSLGPHDFYVGQFPWIYLIYVAIALSPLCYVVLTRRAEGR